MASQPSSSQQYLGDLEKCGIATENNLRQLLTTCPDPVEGIRNFQQANSIQLPSLTPVMKLLDLHGIRRTEYHESVIAELTDRMTTKLRALGERPTSENVHKLEQHLEQCFKLYRVPRIRPIVLETLAQLPKVADRYLKLIICDKEFYDQCAVSVKQQIWIKNESLFLEAVEPVLEAYIHEKDQQLLFWTGPGVDKHQQPQQQISTVNYFNSDSWKGRRYKKHIQDLMNMIGQRELLYTRLTDIIRERFLATDNPHYCSIRFELLMAAHDVNMEFLSRVDPCHDFAWCLDACAKHHRARLIDAQQMSKLRTLLEVGKKGQQTKAIAEMSLIAGDPHILNMIVSAAIKTIRDNAYNPNTVKPRELNSLQLMVKMVLMGLHTKELLTEQTTLQQLMDPQLFTVFLTAFTTMIVQDIIRNELNNAPEDVSDLFPADRDLHPRHASLDRFLLSSRLCAFLWLHHIITSDVLPLSNIIMAKRRPFDSASALRFLDILPQLADQMPLQHPHWAHLFTHRLLNSTAVFSSEPTANVLIHRLFVPQLHNIPSIKFHLLHLVTHHCATIPPELFMLAADPLFDMAMEETEGETALNFYLEFEKYRVALAAQRQQIREKDMLAKKKDEEEEKMEEEEGRKEEEVEEHQEMEVEEDEERKKRAEEEEEKRRMEEEEKRRKEEEEEEEKRKMEEEEKRRKEEEEERKRKKREEKKAMRQDEDLEEGEIEDDDEDENEEEFLIF